MIRRVVGVAVWLAAASAAIGGLYWAFLNTPDSNALTLTLSTALVLLLVVVTAVAVTAGVLLALGETLAVSLHTSVRRVHWFVAAALPALFLMWAIRRGDDWVAQYSGEISAWVIATFGLADATPFFRAARYLSVWLRWVVVPAAALAALTVALRSGAGSVVSPRWIRAAWHWRTLLVATAAFLILIEAPWQLANWRPNGLPRTWVEPALAGARLLVAGLAAAIGAAIIVVTTARAAAHRS